MEIETLSTGWCGNYATKSLGIIDVGEAGESTGQKRFGGLSGIGFCQGELTRHPRHDKRDVLSGSLSKDVE
jgi:hypothetical protein